MILEISSSSSEQVFDMAAHMAIPTSFHPESGSDSSVDLAFISRAKARGKEALSSRRPWKEVVHTHAFNLPNSIPDLYLRVQTNMSYFTINYVIIALFVTFFGLLWFPVSLIVFIVMLVAWHFLYFLRAGEDEIVVYGKVVSNQIVLVGLSVSTFVAMFITGATWDILWSSVVAAVVLLIHAVFRKTDDLCSDEVGPTSTSLPAFN